MDEKSTDIIKPQDIELSHTLNPYEKPSEIPNLENRILPPDINANEYSLKSPQKLSTKPFMPIPKRIILLSLLLFIIGSSFLISGLFDYFQGDRERGIAFIVFGSLMFIPGLYYTYQVYLACMAGTPEERQEILEDIPQIDY